MNLLKYICWCLLLQCSLSIENSIHTHSSEKCNELNLTITCDLRNETEKVKVIVSSRKQKPKKELFIYSLSSVELHNGPKGYSNITIHGSQNVYSTGLRGSEYSDYQLYLVNCHSSSLIENVAYFKAIGSSIQNLVLSYTKEFDIVNSTVQKLESVVRSSTPSITNSQVDELTLKIEGDAILTIFNSEIKLIKNLTIVSTEEGSVSDSLIYYIKKDGLHFDFGHFVFRNTIMKILEGKSIIIEKSTVIFDNVTYDDAQADSLILSKDGKFMSRNNYENGTYEITFSVTPSSNKSYFTPLSIIDTPIKGYWIYIVLAVLIAALVVYGVVISALLYRKRSSSFDHVKKKPTERKISREYMSSSKLNALSQTNDLTMSEKVNAKENYNESTHIDIKTENLKIPLFRKESTVGIKKGDGNLDKIDLEEYYENDVNEEVMENYTEPDVIATTSLLEIPESGSTSAFVEEMYTENDNVDSNQSKESNPSTTFPNAPKSLTTKQTFAPMKQPYSTFMQAIPESKILNTDTANSLAKYPNKSFLSKNQGNLAIFNKNTTSQPIGASANLVGKNVQNISHDFTTFGTQPSKPKFAKPLPLAKFSGNDSTPTENDKEEIEEENYYEEYEYN